MSEEYYKDEARGSAASDDTAEALVGRLRAWGSDPNFPKDYNMPKVQAWLSIAADVIEHSSPNTGVEGWNEDTVEPLVRLCYRLGRHLLNPDNIPLKKWAWIGCEMLAELRKIDPSKYDETMKPNTGVEGRKPASERIE